MTISMDKQYRTRNGCEVRLLMVDGGGRYPVIGAYKAGTRWEVGRWTDSGASLLGLSGFDLIEVTWFTWFTRENQMATTEAIIRAAYAERDREIAEALQRARRFVAMGALPDIEIAIAKLGGAR